MVKMRTIKIFAIAVAIVIAAFIVLFLLPNLMPGRSIHCWVKVVDQNDKGISGYNLRVLEDRASIIPFFSANSMIRFLKSDSEGMIEYKVKGATTGVFFGYDWGNQWRLNPSYLMERSCLKVQMHDYRRAISEKAPGCLGSKENPYLIHVISVGPPQKLLYWEKKVRLKEPMNFACVDILSGKVWESAKPEGDIAMRDNPFTEENIQNNCIQSFVSSKDCSLYPVADDWGIEPPPIGYKSELCKSKDWMKLGKKGGAAIQGIYFRFKNFIYGREYFGRIEICGSGRISDGELKCYINLQGERNLFYKGYTDLLDQKIQDYISPPVFLPLENPLKSKPQ